MGQDKGVTGKILTIVMTLIIALIALLILWTFLINYVPLIAKGLEEATKGFRKWVCCDLIGGWVAWVTPFCMGICP